MARPKKNPQDICIKQSVSFPPALLERVSKYCQAEERPISWVVQKALIEWLEKRNY